MTVAVAGSKIGIESREIAAPPGIRRHRGQEGQSPANPRSLVVAEEESFVLSFVDVRDIDRPPDAEAELVQFERRNRLRPVVRK